MAIEPGQGVAVLRAQPRLDGGALVQELGEEFRQTWAPLACDGRHGRDRNAGAIAALGPGQHLLAILLRQEVDLVPDFDERTR